MNVRLQKYQQQKNEILHHAKNNMCSYMYVRLQQKLNITKRISESSVSEAFPREMSVSIVSYLRLSEWCRIGFGYQTDDWMHLQN